MNEKTLHIKLLDEHYHEFARLTDEPAKDYTLHTSECEILSPHVDVEVVRAAKEKYLNSRDIDSNFKVVVVNVPLLIVFE